MISVDVAAGTGTREVEVLLPAVAEPDLAFLEEGEVRIRQEAEGEVYLKLRQVDLANLDKIARFASEYGVLGVRANNFAAVAKIEGTKTDRAIARVRAQADAVRQLLHQRAQDSLWQLGQRVRGETVSEFAFAADWLHDLTSLWQKTQGVAVDPAAWRVIDGASANDFTAHKWLERGLNAALAPFHPRAMLRLPKDYRGHPTDAPKSAEVEFMTAPLFSICALELFNHIAEEAEYRTCGNETCGRLFVRQEGRARAGQNRTRGALLFCSNRCKSAHHVRKSRARNRAVARPTSDRERNA